MRKFLLILLMAVLISCGKEVEQVIETNTESETVTEAEIEIDLTAVKQYITANYADVVIDGSTSMIPLHQSLDKLAASQENDIYHSRTVDAFEKFITGENDILLGVDYSDELLDKAKAAGVNVTQLPITREAFIFLINRNNTVNNLTTAQIKDIYSGKITNWNELGGDDAPITAFQRNGDSGSQIRMVKFMEDTPLMTYNVNYVSMMGWVIEEIANYDSGRHSIAYNIYTFAEKQYGNSEVTLLSVDGVYPNDDTIFDGSYPLNIYNYIYYDANNDKAAEYAINLHTYLMSDEGQKLISDAGYVNLNTKLDRNTDVSTPYDYGYDYGRDVGFYDEKTGKFFDATDAYELRVSDNYPDYVLNGTKYIDNVKAREYLELIFNSEIDLAPHTAWLSDGVISLQPWFDASFDADDFFNVRYDGKYYSDCQYYIDKDIFRLTASSQENFDYYDERGEFEKYSEYVKFHEHGAVIEFTWNDLNKLYIRSSYEYGNPSIEYIQPFKDIEITEDSKNYLLEHYTDIAIDGSTSMIPLHGALEQLFVTDSNGLEPHSKTVDAFNKLLTWKKLILLSVDFSDELMQKAADNGADIVKLPITREAFAFLINRNNPVKSLTVQQIKDIYSGKITNWSEVGGDDAPIQAFQRNSDSGSQIRMEKFMGGIPLITADVQYIQSMSGVVEMLADFDQGKYSIAYNMYTFTEKQYVNDEVTLLSVDGVFPDDETVFDGSYPITIYNYIYYDSHNAEAAEYAKHLHAYLMSDEGQQLISDAGYVNLNKKLDRNKEIYEPDDYEYTNWTFYDFYDPEKGEFYDTTDSRELMVFDNYADYVLHNTKYMDDEKAREFVTLVFDSGVMRSIYTLGAYEEADYIDFTPWFDASWDPEDLFNFRYGGKYYDSMKYNIKDGTLTLSNVDEELFNAVLGVTPLSVKFADYIPDYEYDAVLTLTMDDLKDLELRSFKSFDWDKDKIEIEYFMPFK